MLQLQSGLFSPPHEPGIVLLLIKNPMAINNKAGRIRMKANIIVFIMYKLQSCL